EAGAKETCGQEACRAPEAGGGGGPGSHDGRTGAGDLALADQFGPTSKLDSPTLSGRVADHARVGRYSQYRPEFLYEVRRTKVFAAQGPTDGVGGRQLYNRTRSWSAKAGRAGRSLPARHHLFARIGDRPMRF